MDVSQEYLEELVWHKTLEIRQPFQKQPGWDAFAVEDGRPQRAHMAIRLGYYDHGQSTK